MAELPIYPSAVIYSERSLNLRAPGVREVRCQDQEAAYRFRYDGLKLVLQSGDQYLFLPEAWTPRDGGRDPHAPQRHPPPGVHPGVGSPNHPGRDLLRPAPRRPAVPGWGAAVAEKLNLLYIWSH